VLRHRFHNHGAETAPLRRGHERPVTLDPAHGEGVALDPPADIDATPIPRQRLVFPGVGGELVEHESNGLGGSRLNAQLGAMHGNTTTNEVGEGRELGANQVDNLDAIPFVSDERVLIS
jgi:hypothetical protein